MLTHLKRLLSTLAVLLVVGAQVVGLQRGYECRHHEAAVFTLLEHCHHTEAGYVACADVAENEAAGHHDDDEHGHEHEKAPERHSPLMVSTDTGTTALAGVALPHFISILMAELPAFDYAFLLENAATLRLMLPPDTGGERPPPAAVQVAHCMVLRV